MTCRRNVLIYGRRRKGRERGETSDSQPWERSILMSADVTGRERRPGTSWKISSIKTKHFPISIGIPLCPGGFPGVPGKLPPRSDFFGEDIGSPRVSTVAWRTPTKKSEGAKVPVAFPKKPTSNSGRVTIPQLEFKMSKKIHKSTKI